MPTAAPAPIPAPRLELTGAGAEAEADAEAGAEEVLSGEGAGRGSLSHSRQNSSIVHRGLRDFTPVIGRAGPPRSLLSPTRLGPFDQRMIIFAQARPQSHVRVCFSCMYSYEVYSPWVEKSSRHVPILHRKASRVPRGPSARTAFCESPKACPATTSSAPSSGSCSDPQDVPPTGIPLFSLPNPVNCNCARFLSMAAHQLSLSRPLVRMDFTS
mmetsp:Transcript_33356/g.73491  ORF Transcript_33356/g.73491 Transcript_33356/m.73491 type:complete len:213 (-) Transcript_33356:16-654(-)